MLLMGFEGGRGHCVCGSMLIEQQELTDPTDEDGQTTTVVLQKCLIVFPLCLTQTLRSLVHLCHWKLSSLHPHCYVLVLLFVVEQPCKDPPHVLLLGLFSRM